MISVPDLVFVAVLALAWPLYEALVDWPHFQRRLRRDGARARLFEYRRSIVQQWMLTAVALVLWTRAGRSLADLGLRAPAGSRLWISALLLLAFAAMQVRQVRRMWNDPAARARLRNFVAQMKLDDVMPHTTAEFRSMAALSLTAAFVEELLFRGWFVAVVAPALGWWSAAAFSVIAFGVLHAYQGGGGVLRTAIVGAVMTLIVAATGSLVPAMVLHALLDLGAGACGWIALSESSPQQTERLAGA